LHPEHAAIRKLHDRLTKRSSAVALMLRQAQSAYDAGDDRRALNWLNRIPKGSHLQRDELERAASFRLRILQPLEQQLSQPNTPTRQRALLQEYVQLRPGDAARQSELSRLEAALRLRKTVLVGSVKAAVCVLAAAALFTTLFRARQRADSPDAALANQVMSAGAGGVVQPAAVGGELSPEVVPQEPVDTNLSAAGSEVRVEEVTWPDAALSNVDNTGAAPVQQPPLPAAEPSPAEADTTPVAAVPLDLAPADSGDGDPVAFNSAIESERPALPPVPSVHLSPLVFQKLQELLDPANPRATVDSARVDALRTSLKSTAAPPAAADLAAALGLRRNLKHRESLESLEAAAQQSGPLAARARQLLIREDLRTTSHGAALASLERLAEDVHTHGHDWAPRDRWETIEWIGVVIGWMQGPGKSGRAPVDAAAAGIRSLLNDDESAAFDAGIAMVHSEQARLEAERDALKALVEEEQQAERIKLTEKQADLAQRESILSTSAQEARAQATAELQKFDQQLAELDRSYVEHEAVDRRLSLMILPIETAIQLLLQRKQNSNLGLQRAEADELARLGDQFARLARLRDENRVAARTIALQAQQVAQSRQRLVQQHAAQSGAVQGELQSISKWQQRVSRQAVSAAEATPDQAGRIKALDRKIRDLATYDRYNLQDESRRLLARFRIEE